MEHFLKIVVCFFVLALDFVNAYPYTTFPIGKHKFFGNVRCANGNPIADHAIVVLRERDDISGVDDVDRMEIKADPDPIQSGMFELDVPADFGDPPTGHLELFLEFWNVCYEGEEKASGFLKENWWVEYVIEDNKIWAQPRDPQKI